MTKLVIDSSAWIEYLAGTHRGEKIKEYFEKAELFTSAVCVAEITAKVLKEGLSAEIVLAAIRARSSVLSVDFQIGSEAGKKYAVLRKKKPKIALSDAISLVFAEKINAKVLTFDRDFEGLPQTIVLP